MLKASQVGPLLGLSPRTVYELARTGALPSYRFGDAVRFDPADVETYRTSCRSTGTSPTSAGAISSTASLTDDDAALAAYFRKAGLKPRRMPTTSRKPSDRPPLRMVSSTPDRR